MDGKAEDLPVALERTISTAVGVYRAQRTARGWTIAAPDTGDPMSNPGPYATWRVAQFAAQAHAKRVANPHARARGDLYIRYRAAHNRQTGTEVQILDAQHPDHAAVKWPRRTHGKRWIAACITHRKYEVYGQLHEARRAVVLPRDWCSSCAAIPKR